MRNKWVYGLIVLLGLPLLNQVSFCADLTSDSAQIANWFSKEVGDLMAFQAASTHFLPGNTVGFPGVEVGVAGGVAATKLDVNGFRALPLNTLETSQFDIPKMIAAPIGVLHAKAGLPGGWDVGAKGGAASLDLTNGGAKTKFTNKVYGVEVRKRLLGGGLTGVAMPDLSVSLGYDRASGDITRTGNYNAPIAGGNLNANTSWKSTWNVGAVTARAVVSKKFFIITPFVGVGVSKMMGKTDTTVGVDVISDTVPGGLANVSVKGSAKAKETVAHGVAGLELSPAPFFKINVGGLVAANHWAASLGLRVQFP